RDGYLTVHANDKLIDVNAELPPDCAPMDRKLWAYISSGGIPINAANAIPEHIEKTRASLERLQLVRSGMSILQEGLTCALPLALLLLLGIAKLAVGLGRGRPVSFL